MKRKAFLLKISVLLCISILLFSGCQDVKDEEIKDEVVKEYQEMVNEKNKDLEITKEILDSLVEKNFDCLINIFSVSTLPYEMEGASRSDFLVPVKSNRFETYNDFKNYIESTYSSKESDRLLNNYPYEGEPLYSNVDGQLYIDVRKAGGKGYYVNWKKRDIEIISLDTNKCKFKINTYIEEPSEAPIEEKYEIDAEAAYENDSWLLEKMYY